MKRIFRRALVAIALSSFALPEAHATTYTVNTSSDSVVANACANHQAGCSLRGAIQEANAHSGDTIVFNIFEFCGSGGCVINLLSALPDISASISISGPSTHAIQRSSSAATNFRVFNVTVATTGTVNISDLTIKQGSSSANGGGLQNSTGTLNVINCVFQGNVANNGGGISCNGLVNVTNCTFTGNIATNGGGIYNDGGTLNVANCTFTGNKAGGDGGGIANDHYRTANVSNSTFIGNSANEGDPTASGGGAICNGDHNHSQGGFLTVTNTTITGNSALRCGGISTAGGAAAGLLTVTNSTIVGNSSFFSDSAGGISKDGEGAPVNIKNTIVALNTGAAGGRDVFSAFVSSGFNLIGKIEGSTGFTAPTDLTGTIASPLDPKLDPAGLQNNGGPTQTIALLPGSPALDKGTSSGLTGNLTSDQRGANFARALDYTNIANAPGGDSADIGACEGTRVQITSMTHLANGHILLQGLGFPSRAHAVEISPDLSPGSFSPLPLTAAADGTGVLQYDDSTAVGLPKHFYRLRFP